MGINPTSFIFIINQHKLIRQMHEMTKPKHKMQIFVVSPELTIAHTHRVYIFFFFFFFHYTLVYLSVSRSRMNFV